MMMIVTTMTMIETMEDEQEFVCDLSNGENQSLGLREFNRYTVRLCCATGIFLGDYLDLDYRTEFLAKTQSERTNQCTKFCILIKYDNMKISEEGPSIVARA